MSSPAAPSRRLVALALLIAAAFVRPVCADDAKDKNDDAKKEAEEPPALVAAEKGPFAVVVELDGVLDAKDAAAVEVHTDQFGGELEAKSAPVTAPTMVKAGDVLVAFDTEKIDDQIAQAKREVELGRVAFERAKEEGRRDAEEAERTLARSKIERARAVEALEYFNKTDRARRALESEIGLKSSEDSVQDQREELDQLRKMYKADDVVEETEAIVMRRSERSLARAEKYLAITREEHDRLMKVELPRALEDHEHAAAAAVAADEKSSATIPMDLEKGRKELAKTELELSISIKNLSKLEKDRTLFEVKAPIAGLAVPGALSRGKWSGGDDVVKALKTKDGLKPRQVLFTILPGGALLVRTHVPEASILDVSVGMTASVELAAVPRRTFSAKVVTVGITSDDGKFDVDFDLVEKDDRFVPGFAAKLKLTTANKPDAITLPEDAVVSKGDTHKVFVWAEGKSTARDVEIGATSGGRIEIVKGLDAGTKVLESPPR